MNLKPLAITTGILAALSAITWFATRTPAPVRESNDRTGEYTAPSDLVSTATRITIVDEGKTVELTKNDGQAWQVSNFHELPVDFAKLKELVSQLTKTKIERFVTASPERIKRLGLDTARITFQSPDAPPLSLDLGRITENGARFIRRTGETSAYLARLDLWLDAVPQNWANSSLLTLSRDDIAKVELALPGAPPLTITRKDKAEPFAIDPARDDTQLKPTELDSLLDSLITLRFKDTADPTSKDVTAARQHTRTITLTTFDQRVLTFTIGRRPAIPAPPKPAETTASTNPTQPASTAPSEEGTPAGPVYIWIDDTRPDPAITRLMKERAIEINEHIPIPTTPGTLLEKKPSAAAPKPAPPKP
ncbi:MAG: DUF4340 domain-containing protein [Puniceicoccales bacterium]|jgi:hypothetical protein|nr:DUF4340 domain-containing protein [Puniceicoccales bacterium]